MAISSHLPKAMLTSTLLLLSIFLTLNQHYCEAQSYPNNVLYSPSYLGAGTSLDSGIYSLKMQYDCNLALYEGRSAVWSSNTMGKGSNCRCAMQRDGNLVIYNEKDTAVWASNTWQMWTGHFVLILQKDRNLVIYGGAEWSTNTYSIGTGVSVNKRFESKNITSTNTHTKVSINA